MKERVVIFHGNCIDGFTAAWAAWRRFGEGDTEYLAANHGDQPPDVSNRDVVIVDFSYPRQTLIAMAETARSILLLDHHKSAMEELADLPFTKFDMNRSGAGITWDELHSQPRPWVIDYVEDRDLWRFKLPESKSVNAWISTQVHTFENWEALNSFGLANATMHGSGVLAYIDRYVHDMSKHARTVHFCGQDVPMVNAPYVNISELVGHLAESAPFAIGWWQRGDGVYIYSLRSRGNIDVAEIAKRFGGGGHKNAAGFQSKTRLEQLM